jgi:hypothetical protein
MSLLTPHQRDILERLKQAVEVCLTSNSPRELPHLRALAQQLTEDRLVRTENLIIPTQGREILLRNTFFRDLLALVQSIEFKTFYQRHMNRSIDHKPALIYVELHTVLNKIYTAENNGVPMSAEMGALVLQTIMQERTLRGPLVRLITGYLDGETTKPETYDSVKRILTENRQYLLMEEEEE